MSEISTMSEISQSHYRKAEACRHLADLSPEPDRKAHWLEKADEWDTLAAQAETKPNLLLQ